MLPLCVSVIPWGILAGSMAIQTGLSFWQSVGMSAIVFAGAAQLVTLGLLITGASFITIIASVFFITSQHLIYGLNLRKKVSSLPLKKRLLIGFLLTDELFALSSKKNQRDSSSFKYLLGAGCTFYIGWFTFSLMGIAMANSIPDLNKYHLDFSIIATFITIIVPMTKKTSTLIGIIWSLLTSMLFAYINLEGAIVIAGCSGMIISVFASRIMKEQK
ncbi:branched-chain amino acid ABC transporter permease [Pseudomonas sp. TTU2014-080ASC]|nr:branched-chain amino acid ABC transporter permease [Pseudomonas sp. TTU2014-080ASC]